MQSTPAVLTRELWFPNPRFALGGELNGLLAIGGDLSPPRLLLAYQSGIFPWTADPITWWSPDPRGIFPLENLHVPRSLRALLRKKRFSITRDQAFGAVMRGCAAAAPGRESTWICEQFQQAYGELHRLGHAHSVECWHNEVLVGGIYGVSIGGFFAGESMFHTESGASKVALHSLLCHLRDTGFRLCDTQVITEATRLMGAINIPRTEYLERLSQAIQAPIVF